MKHKKRWLLLGTACLGLTLLTSMNTALARHHHTDSSQQEASGSRVIAIDMPEKQTDTSKADTSNAQQTVSAEELVRAAEEAAAKEEAAEKQKAEEAAAKKAAEEKARAEAAKKAKETVKADSAKSAAAAQTEISSVRIEWPVVTGAVQYQLVLLSSAEDTPSDIVLTKDHIYTNGITLNLGLYGRTAKDFYWKVCPLDYNQHAIAPFSTPRPLTDGTVLNPQAPQPTTEFTAMDYAPVYPVYSWIPLAGCMHHEVQVFYENIGSDELVTTLQAGQYDVYDERAYTRPGSYYWHVRAVAEDGTPISDWSERSSFTVTHSVTFAALGDSITHGGGVISVPPGYTRYNWETYAGVPVKNIGFSGDTTEAMLERFDKDVLPFMPKVLVIMGGVNDYRLSTLGWRTVQHLTEIKKKCDAYGIIPVFVTPTPINPYLMVHRAGIESPYPDWWKHQEYVKDWVMRQKYHVDVASALTDSNHELRADYTTDGLHPDYEGKKYIGETIGNYLKANFAWLLPNS